MLSALYLFHTASVLPPLLVMLAMQNTARLLVLLVLDFLRLLLMLAVLDFPHLLSLAVLDFPYLLSLTVPDFLRLLLSLAVLDFPRLLLLSAVLDFPCLLLSLAVLDFPCLRQVLVLSASYLLPTPVLYIPLRPLALPQRQTHWQAFLLQHLSELPHFRLLPAAPRHPLSLPLRHVFLRHLLSLQLRHVP